jgi:hypothetical protein
VGADVVRILYGRQHRGAVIGLACSIPPGSKEQGMCTPGFPRNVGDPAVSRLKDPDGGHRMTQPLVHRARARRGAERKQAQGRYCQAKATKCGGMDGGKSEHRIVLLKRGNPAPWETPWKEGDAESWNR